MEIGIKIKYKDGDCDYLDPVNTDHNKHTNTEYVFYQGGYEHVFNKDEVEAIEEYDLCSCCGHEEKYGMCQNYNCKTVNNPL